MSRNFLMPCLPAGLALAMLLGSGCTAAPIPDHAQAQLKGLPMDPGETKAVTLVAGFVGAPLTVFPEGTGHAVVQVAVQGIGTTPDPIWISVRALPDVGDTPIEPSPTWVEPSDEAFDWRAQYEAQIAGLFAECSRGASCSDSVTVELAWAPQNDSSDSVDVELEAFVFSSWAPPDDWSGRLEASWQ